VTASPTSVVNNVNNQKSPSSPPVAVHVHVDSIVRKHFNLPNSHRKFRFLISTKQKEEESEPTTLIRFREMIEGRVPILTNQPYRLNFLEDQKDLCPEVISDEEMFSSLLSTAVSSQKYSLILNLEGTPGLFPPPVTPSGSPLSRSSHPDPLLATSYTMISFFAFHAINDPFTVKEELFELWKPFKVLGRVYIAKEGINAQMAIPSNVLSCFQEITKANPIFLESSFNNDLREITKEEYLKLKPFTNLHIRIRNQIVTDGFEGLINFLQHLIP
jgi:hypothetical protein